jgi:TP901 family phage tail tape measure protein
MPDYDLGTARGKIDLDSDGMVTGFGKAEAAQNKFTRGSKVAGGIIAGAGLAIAAGLGLAINSAANFEQRMSAVEAVSGASGKELEKLRETALRLGADTKFSATEAASAIEELVKAGVPVEDVLNGAADAAVNLAAAGEIDLAQAATIASNALNVFNLEGKDMEHVADLIAGAANASAIDVSEFGQSLQQAGATASLVGLDFDDLTLAIAAMGNAGIKGSDAGTSLKTFLANLQPVTKKQIDLFKELGLVTEDGGNKFFDASGKIKPMREIAETLQTALVGLTDQQKALALETLFGSDAIRAAAIIAEEGGEGFDKLAASVGKTSAADVAAKRMDNLKGSLEQLKGSLETLLIQIGTPLLKGIRGVVDFLTKLVNKFGELSPSVQKTIGIILAVVAAFLLIGGTILLVVGWFGTVATAVGLTAGALAGIIAVAFVVVVAIGALVAAVVILWRENETFRNIIKGVWEWIKDFIPKAIDAVKVAIESLIGAYQAVAAFITDTVMPVVREFAAEFMERWNSLIAWLRANVFPVFIAFGQMIMGVVQFIIGAWNLLWPVTQAIWNAILLLIQTAITNIQIVIQAAIAIIQVIWRNFGQVLWNAVVVIWNLIRGVIEGALQVIKGIIQVITGIITLNWKQVWEGIKNIVLGQWNIMKAIVSAAIGAIKVLISAAIAFIKSIWQAGWIAIKTFLQTTWNTIKAVVSGALGAIKGLISAAIGALKSAWNAGWGAIRDTVKRVTGEVIDFVKTIPGKIVSALGDLGGLLVSSGADLIRGFIEGIRNMIPSIGDAVGAIKDQIPSWVDGPLGIFSPSKFMAWRGKMVMLGFQKGIEDQMVPLAKLMKGVSTSVQADLVPGSASPQPFGATNNIAPVINLNFPNVKSGADAEGVKSALSDGDVLNSLIHATRAGVGAR